jgi:hypothetical protein
MTKQLVKYTKEKTESSYIFHYWYVIDGIEKYIKETYAIVENKY